MRALVQTRDEMRTEVRTEMIIRPFRAGDEAAVKRLRGALDRTHAGLLPDYFRAPVEPALPERDAASAIFVAETGEAVCGFVVVRMVETPRDPTMTPRRRAHVEMIVVGESARRRGAGTRLMAEAEAWAHARGCAEVVLTVWSDNHAAEALYRALGYQPIARVLRKPTS